MPDPALPAPPLVTHLLLEDPFWVVFSLLAAGAALYVLAGRMNRPGLQKTAALPPVLGLIVLGLAMLIQTDREILAGRTLALAQWLAEPEPPKVPGRESGENPGLAWIEAQLDPGFMLQIEGRLFDRRRVLQSARWVVDRREITDVQIQDLQAHLDHRLSGRTLLRVRAWIKGRPVRSSWMLYWHRASETGGWTLRQIDWISFEGQTPSPSLLP